MEVGDKVESTNIYHTAIQNKIGVITRIENHFSYKIIEAYFDGFGLARVYDNELKVIRNE